MKYELMQRMKLSKIKLNNAPLVCQFQFQFHMKRRREIKKKKNVYIMMTVKCLPIQCTTRETKKKINEFSKEGNIHI